MQRNDDGIYRDKIAPITDDNGDTIFGNEVQPKPTSPGHDYECSSPTATPVPPGSRQYASIVGFSPTSKIDGGGAQHIGGGSLHPSG
jgi:hypothetical protein